MINTREEIIQLIPDNSIGCELGVFEGNFSQILLDSNRFNTLYLVDSFDGLVQSGDKNGNDVKYINGDQLYNSVKNRFSNNKQILVVKDTSYNFLNQQPDNSLDFIYIDTTHIYEDTKMELELSWKKVKSGGIISGHDYNKQQFPGLVTAVDEFLDKHNIKDCIFTKQDILETYLFRKN